MLEAVVGVLLGTAGCLHHAVEAHESITMMSMTSAYRLDRPRQIDFPRPIDPTRAAQPRRTSRPARARMPGIAWMRVMLYSTHSGLSSV